MSRYSADLGDSHVADEMASETKSWRAVGLFSDHFLTYRLKRDQSDFWESEAQANAGFDFVTELFKKYSQTLKDKSEEENEKYLISPILEALGFHTQNRAKIPGILLNRRPDYLLYASQTDSDRAFKTGVYYASCIGLVEAKRWSQELNIADNGKSAQTPAVQLSQYLSNTAGVNWGILTNGRVWRIQARTGVASAYFEFDLAKIAQHDGLEAGEKKARDEFRLFYSLFHQKRFARRGETCDLELIRQEAQRFREEVEEDLRKNVFECVEKLAKGYLYAEDNGLTTENLPEIYENCLIILYRILFVLNAEARELLPTTTADDRSRAYVNDYGIDLVRQILSGRGAQRYQGEATFELNTRFRSLFALINGKPPAPGKPDMNEKLNIPRYNGGLFDPERYPFLLKKQVPDFYLSEVIRLLTFREDSDKQVYSFDYLNLGERHLGSIYEGLLEHRLESIPDAAGFDDIKLVNDKGERKTSGAYYTPQGWVEYIVRKTISALLPPDETPDDASVAPDDSFAKAALKLKICDPAMGSGHFLVEACSFLAEVIATHPTTQIYPPNEGSQETTLAYWKRRVVESCIYGVDVNPLAVELAKLSLWLKTVDRVPLNFLDHHIRSGNSLVGANLKAIQNFPKLNDKKQVTIKPGMALGGLFTAGLRDTLSETIQDIHRIEDVPTDSHAAAKEKEKLWKEISGEKMPSYRELADLWMAPWFGGELNYSDYLGMFDDSAHKHRLYEKQEDFLKRLSPFHWELEFPDIFFDEAGAPRSDAGFDAVIGNPPWERIKLQENEFFASRSKAIVEARTAADRKKLIAELKKSAPELSMAFEKAKDRADRMLYYTHKSTFFPLMGRGDTNLYAVFAEKALQLIHPKGRVGLLVPSGISSDDTTKGYFQELVTHRQLAELIDFENHDNGGKRIFADVDSRFKFSILLMSGKGSPQPEAKCGFYLHEIEEIEAPDRIFTLTQADFKLFNPNTLTCPIFRRKRDMELTRKLYSAAPILIRETLTPEQSERLRQGELAKKDDVAKSPSGLSLAEQSAKILNPWGVRFSTLFHMTNDSHLFHTSEALVDDGFFLSAGNLYQRGKEKFLPLYEGKMVQMYDHRAAGIKVNSANVHRPAQEAPTTAAQYLDLDYSPKPQFWVDSQAVNVALGGEPQSWLLGFKDVTAPTNMRTMICSLIPYSAVGNTFCLIKPSANTPIVCLQANLSSFVLDFVARQKVGGQHLNFYIVEQLPVLPPERYSEQFGGVLLSEFVKARVLELTYTAHDMTGFARAMGYAGEPFRWDEERRLHLKCQLDALYFLLYGLNRTEAQEVLETFPIVKKQDEAKYNGVYRTRDLILGYMAAFAAGNMDARVKG